MVLGQCRPFWGAFRSSPKNRQKQGTLIKCVFAWRPRLSPFEGRLSARAVGALYRSGSLSGYARRAVWFVHKNVGGCTVVMILVVN
jgi:hypothetical protein